MYYVNEKTGDCTNYPQHHTVPCRKFSDDESYQAYEYADMIKERIRNQEELEKEIRNSRNVSSSNNSVNNNYSNASNRSAKMHWIYFLLIGWWLGITLACLIVPLFIRGLIKKSFGYW